MYHYIDGLVEDYSNSIANALELLQCCNKPSILPTALQWQLQNINQTLNSQKTLPFSPS